MIRARVLDARTDMRIGNGDGTHVEPPNTKVGSGWLNGWSSPRRWLSGEERSQLLGQKKLVVACQSKPVFVILVTDDDLAIAVQDVAQQHAADAALLSEVLFRFFPDIHHMHLWSPAAARLRAILICIGF